MTQSLIHFLKNDRIVNAAYHLIYHVTSCPTLPGGQCSANLCNAAT